MSGYPPLNVAAAVIPIISGSISVVGSVTLILVMVRSEKKVSTTYRRLVFGMSIFDTLFSLACLSSTFASPRNSAPIWIAFGNRSTCTLQGIMTYTGSVGTTMYNSMLSIYYMLTISYNVREETMIKRIEPFFHAIPIMYIISTNALLLSTSSFNAMGALCGIASSPKGCSSDPDIECERGINANKYIFYFQGYPIMFMFVMIVSSMVAVYCSVRRQEIKMERYRGNHSTLPSRLQELRRKSSTPASNSTNVDVEMNSPIHHRNEHYQSPVRRAPRTNPLSRNRRAAMVQCFFYVAAFLLTWVFAIIVRFVPGNTAIGDTFWILANLFSPLQGFFNFLVFIRPQVIELRNFDNISTWKAVVKIVKQGGVDLGVRRRRESLRDTQQNGGRRFTAREWHMQESARQAQELVLLEEGES